jgi:hypothetical protein
MVMEAKIDKKTEVKIVTMVSYSLSREQAKTEAGCVRLSLLELCQPL